MDSTNIYFILVTVLGTGYTVMKQTDRTILELITLLLKWNTMEMCLFDAGTDPVIAYNTNNTFPSVLSFYPHINLVFFFFFFISILQMRKQIQKDCMTFPRSFSQTTTELRINPYSFPFRLFLPHQDWSGLSCCFCSLSLSTPSSKTQGSRGSLDARTVRAIRVQMIWVLSDGVWREDSLVMAVHGIPPSSHWGTCLNSVVKLGC